MSALKFLTDENFGSAILRGLLRRNPKIDIVRVQDHGLANTDDPLILEWAASQGRIILTHDLRTMPDFAYERIAHQQKMPGLIAMRQDIHIGTAINNILLIIECMTPEELENGVLRLPLQDVIKHSSMIGNCPICPASYFPP
jgi:predicted nuclease of predicted toxin-antitoxin system